MIDHPALRGILPVLQIPFRGAGVEQVVDDESLRAEVDFCIAAGVDGLVVPALASEFMVLAPEERRATSLRRSSIRRRNASRSWQTLPPPASKRP